MRIPVLATMLLMGCAGMPDVARPLQGLALAAALEGAWCNTTDDGRSCWAYDIFRPDGTLRACGRFPDEKQAFDGTGRVSISGQVMCYRVLHATENFWVKPGSTYCTRIVEISATAHTYQDLESGARFKLLRVPSGSVTCPSGVQ